MQNRIVEGILGVVLSDNVKARSFSPMASIVAFHAQTRRSVVRSQIEFQNMAREHAEDGPIPQTVPSALVTP